jgi:nucleotide-binding universal stress UspA family protein
MLTTRCRTFRSRDIRQRADVLRSLLVALDGSPYSDVASTLACDWAIRFGARLLGLGVLAEPSIDRGEPVPLGAFGFKKHRDEALLADAHRRLLDVLTTFRSRCAAVGVTATVLEDIGDPTDRILREAQRCDAVVLGHETHFHFETQDRPDATLAGVIRGCARPVVVVPSDLRGGRGVMVAYSGGRESARTLQMFQLLGLSDSEEIDVVTIRPEHVEAARVAGLAGDFLTAHGAPHRLHAIGSEAAPADVLLEEVRRRAPRLLVMGAPGHHPVRDLFAGSVARGVLTACPVPVFLGT